MNITYDNNGNVIAWGIAVKDPQKEGVNFAENVTVPEDFDGVNYLYIYNQFTEVENDN
jgi:hypothetical protein